MKRETPRYKAEPMRSNDGYWAVTDTHKVVYVEMRISEEKARKIASERNGG